MIRGPSKTTNLKYLLHISEKQDCCCSCINYVYGISAVLHVSLITSKKKAALKFAKMWKKQPSLECECLTCHSSQNVLMNEFVSSKKSIPFYTLMMSKYPHVKCVMFAHHKYYWNDWCSDGLELVQIGKSREIGLQRWNKITTVTPYSLMNFTDSYMFKLYV